MISCQEKIEGEIDKPGGKLKKPLRTCHVPGAYVEDNRHQPRILLVAFWCKLHWNFRKILSTVGSNNLYRL